MTTMSETTDRACQCAEAVNLHSGHCCLRDMPDDFPATEPMPCGHDEDFLARAGVVVHGGVAYTGEEGL